MPLAGGQGGLQPTRNLGVHLTLFQPGGQIMPTTLLLAHLKILGNPLIHWFLNFHFDTCISLNHLRNKVNVLSNATFTTENHATFLVWLHQVCWGHQFGLESGLMHDQLVNFSTPGFSYEKQLNVQTNNSNSTANKNDILTNSYHTTLHKCRIVKTIKF